MSLSSTFYVVTTRFIPWSYPTLKPFWKMEVMLTGSLFVTADVGFAPSSSIRWPLTWSIQRLTNSILLRGSVMWLGKRLGRVNSAAS